MVRPVVEFVKTKSSWPWWAHALAAIANTVGTILLTRYL